MTFAEFQRVIKENDTVILYLGINNMYALEVKPTVVNRHGSQVANVFQSKYGALRVMSLVGREFGCRVQMSHGWAVVLYPTPELWTITLPHRTQILYTTDISMVLGRLCVGPGSVVCEAGTGSGSLSHAFLRAIGPRGHLHTADFHQQRVETATEEFTRHGLGDRVTVSRRDVCSEGWPVEGKADAVFLDLPRPWLALHHAVNAIKSTGGRICSFSPCIEQVSRTCSVMRRLGHQNIRTFEVLTQELQVKQIDVPLVVVTQDDRPHKKLPPVLAAENPNKKARVEGADEVMDTDDGVDSSDVPDIVEDEQTEDKKESTCEEDRTEIATTPAKVDDACNGSRATVREAPKSQSFLSVVPLQKQAGHTGFLTFCFVPPGAPRPAAPVHVEEEHTEAEHTEAEPLEK